MPIGLVLAPEEQPACNAIVTIGEGVGFDLHRFALNTLDRKTAAIHGRLHILDDDACTPVRALLRLGRTGALGYKLL
jgi:hypothetical protein